MRRLSISIECWPIAGRFTIARGSKTEARVLVAAIAEGQFVGRGECVPYPRYGESVEGVTAAIQALALPIAEGASRSELAGLLGPGAARNALDCALWDLEAKQAGKRAWTLAGVSRPRPVLTAYTLSLDTPQAMEAAAQAASLRPLLKVKLGGAGDIERVAAVRRGAPAAALIVDANEAWSEADLDSNFEACHAAGVKLIEQPLPAGKDGLLAEIAPGQRRQIPIFADESVHDRAGLETVGGLYQGINIKLDKTGGLTEALALAAEARKLGIVIMAGSMVGTSLAVAPALLLASEADFVDLDGPLLLRRDREAGLRFDGSLILPYGPELWG